MNIIISGASGLVGSALSAHLRKVGYNITPLVRKDSEGQVDGIIWDPVQNTIDKSRLEGCDAVIHLAGESIAGGRWTATKKRAIIQSRVQGTRLLAHTLSQLRKKPEVFICASAIGFYGDRSDEILTEKSTSGEIGFLPDVCRQWEDSTKPAAEEGIRVVNTRFGLILSKHGGALPTMMRPFQFGVGGKVGDGKQYYSWIAIDDVVAIIQHILNTRSISGPVNVVSPNPISNEDFVRVLGKVLQRPSIMPAPVFALKVIFGQMADELLLASQRVVPACLEFSGYRFRYPDLKKALVHVLTDN